MQQLQIYGPSGLIQIVNLLEFIHHIPIEQVIGDTRVRVPVMKSTTQVFDTTNSYSISASPMISVIENELVGFAQITARTIMRTPSEEFKHYITNYISTQIINEFNIMVAKKTPNDVVKENDINQIQELSIKYAIIGGQDSMGIEHQLSKYQRYFSLADPRDFKFFFTQSKDYKSDSTKLSGKLINIYPEKWFMIRYQDSTFRNDMLSKMRYVK